MSDEADTDDPTELFSRRCPLCQRLCDEKQCPYCGHGTVHYRVRIKHP